MFAVLPDALLNCAFNVSPEFNIFCQPYCHVTKLDGGILNVSVSNTSSVAAPSFFTHLVSTTIVSVVDVFSISQ